MGTAGAVPDDLRTYARAGGEMRAELSGAARQVGAALEVVRRRCPGVPAGLAALGDRLAELARHGADVDAHVGRVADAFAAADSRSAVRAAPAPVVVADEAAWWWDTLPDPVTGLLELLGLLGPPGPWVAALFPALAAGSRLATAEDVGRWLRTVPDDQLAAVARRLIAGLASVPVEQKERDRLARLLAPLRLRLHLHYQTPVLTAGACPPAPRRPADYQRLLDALAGPGRLVRSGGFADGLWSGLIAGNLDAVDYDNPVAEAGRAAGQTIASVLVYGDVRDTLADLISGRPAGAALSAAGFIPGAGDAAKGAKGAWRIVRHADDAAAAARGLSAADRLAVLGRTVPDDLGPADLASLFRRLPVTDPPQPATLARHGIVHADMDHILRRHTFDHFDFGDKARPKNTQFPPGTQAQDVADLVDEALAVLGAAGSVPTGVSQVEVGMYRLQITLVDGPQGRIVAQFFPVDGPGVVPLTRADVHAVAGALA